MTPIEILRLSTHLRNVAKLKANDPAQLAATMVDTAQRLADMVATFDGKAHVIGLDAMELEIVAQALDDLPSPDRPGGVGASHALLARFERLKQ